MPHLKRKPSTVITPKAKVRMPDHWAKVRKSAVVSIFLIAYGSCTDAIGYIFWC
jgi:hypothetical protein